MGGHERFLFSLVLQEGTLQAGEYTLLIDPQWHKSAFGNYKKLNINFNCNQIVELSVAKRAEGQTCLE